MQETLRQVCGNVGGVITIGVVIICIVTFHLIMSIQHRRRDQKDSMLEKKYQEELNQLLERDVLTGLDNSFAFYRRVKKVLGDHPAEAYTILRFDVDQFKLFNDILGVDAGDKLLRELAKFLKTTYGDSCLYARIEADHFAMCLPSATMEVTAVFNEIAAWFAAYVEGYGFALSAGVYAIDNRDLLPSAMCDRALLALEQVKGDEVNLLAFYDDSMIERLVEERNMLGKIYTAFKEEQFVIYLQPQYDNIEECITGAEVLVRWLHPENGLVPPDKFIPLLEKNGLISKLDAYVWEKGCQALRRWLDEKRTVVPISVNISRVDLYDPQLCEKLELLMEKYDLEKNLFRLEITETAYVEHPEQIEDIVEQLHNRGFIIEMDDFGKGQSSLNTLKNLPVDVLKLDLNFLAGTNENRKSGIILNSMVRMAHWMDIPVIAEGVETQSQVAYLKSIGCRLMQGYYFARPMPVEAFEELLAQSKVSEQIGMYKIMENNFENEEFWQPNSQATLLFNSFIGPAMVMEYNAKEARLLRCNDKFLQLLEMKSMHEVVGNCMDRVHVEDQEIAKYMLNKIASEGTEEQSVVRIVIEDVGKVTQKRLFIRGRRIACGSDRCVIYLTVEDMTNMSI